MKVAFLTEMGFAGKVSANYPNLRTEFAWMYALDADHHNIGLFEQVTNYDAVFIIFPKGRVFLSAEGSKLINEPNPVAPLLHSNFIDTLKANNKKVFFIQEGPHWWFNDYEITEQVAFYSLIYSCDAVFAHNNSDRVYYEGMFPNHKVYIMPTLMIEDSIKDVVAVPQDKTIIGGNFARWYGGFESYTVAQEFKNPIWTQTSHAMRENENAIEGLEHLPRVTWVDWIKQLSSFKYAVHLMPTVAAGTFSLNCAYLGIPTIGNIDVDTQRKCHPALSIAVYNIKAARELANKLLTDQQFYDDCSRMAKDNYKQYYSLNVWRSHIINILNETK
jgi:hypothetical protein